MALLDVRDLVVRFRTHDGTIHAVNGISFELEAGETLFALDYRGRERWRYQLKAEAANINKPLPGGAAINNYRWYDYYFFAQDTWRIHPTFSLNYGVRYETPGNAIDSLVTLNESIVAANGGGSVFQLTPVPKRDKNNWQPRIGLAYKLGEKWVLRGGYGIYYDQSALAPGEGGAESGVSEAGLKTTVLPRTRAGMIFHDGIAIGKFHGVIIAQMP